MLLGALVGLGIAVLLGVGFYRGASRVNLRTFFRWTGIALIFIAAGLLSYAVHEFVEIGWITIGTQTLFDASATLPHKAIEGAPGGIVLIVGQFLRALFGYSSQPEVITFVVWATYVVTALVLFLRPFKAAAPADQAQPRHQRGVLRPDHRGSAQRPRSGPVARAQAAAWRQPPATSRSTRPRDEVREVDLAVLARGDGADRRPRLEQGDRRLGGVHAGIDRPQRPGAVVREQVRAPQRRDRPGRGRRPRRSPSSRPRARTPPRAS